MAKRGLRFWLPIIGLWAIAPAALAALIPLTAAMERSDVTTELPATTQVGMRERDLRSDVQLTLTFGASQAAFATSAGLVTAVSATVGEQPTTGAEVLRLDGVSIRAFVADSPIHAPVGPDTKGEATQRVRDYLGEVGYPATLAKNAAYSTSLRTAIRAYQRDIGAAVDGVFQPGYLLFVPTDTGVVESVDTMVGKQLAANDAVLHFAPTPLTAAFAPAAGSTTPTIAAAAEPGPYVLHAGGAAIPLDSLDNLDAAAIPSLIEALAQARQQPTITETEASSTHVYQGLHVALRDPITIATAPVSSLYSTPGGTTCVFTTSSAADHTPTAHSLHEVSSAPGETGIAAIDPDLAGTWIIRDPHTLPAATLDACS